MTAIPSFKQALSGCLPELRAFARSLVGSAHAADDLVQETAMKAWAARDRFEPGTNVRAWLFTILRNTYYSDRRKAGREVEDPEGTISASLATPAEQVSRMELQDFRRALLGLPADQREALILIGASGFSHEEAADIMGCAVGTVKSRVSRARRTLEEMMSAGVLPDGRPSGEAAGALEALIDESRRIAAAS